MVESCRPTLEKPSAYRRNMRSGGLLKEKKECVSATKVGRTIVDFVRDVENKSRQRAICAKSSRF
jgi:hypothetical protein